MNMFAEVFPPGEILREELEARNWTQTELAEIIGRPVRLVNEIISAKKSITPETAIQLGEALGTSPELWMNLEVQYQLFKVSLANKSTDKSVSRRAKLHEMFPVRDMVSRGWINKSDNIDSLEQQVLEFFEIKELNQKPTFYHAARKSNSDENPTIKQVAWLRRAYQIASDLDTKRYEENSLRAAVSKLSKLRTSPQETQNVASILDECGVRFVIVEPIAGSKIDGACFWLSNFQPVIAMTLRIDRIDNFWFVLRHEIEHVLQKHGSKNGYILDQETMSEKVDKINEEENIANNAAADFCVDQSEMSHFLDNGPYYRKKDLIFLARELNIHPGLIVGQLHRYSERYDLFRQYLVKIRSFVISSVRTDGWKRIC